VKYSTELYGEQTEAGTATKRIVPRPSITVRPLTILRCMNCYSCGEAKTNTASYCVRCGTRLRQLYYIASVSLFIVLAIFILSGLSFLGPLGVIIVEATIALLFLRLTYSGYLFLKMIGILS
jgi:hypothetical protein